MSFWDISELGGRGGPAPSLWQYDTKITLDLCKKMEVFNTRFTKCSFTNLPIAEKGKNQELIQNFTSCQKT